MNVLAFTALLVTALGVSLALGGKPERWTAAMFAAAAITSRIGYTEVAHRFYEVEPYVAAVDIALLAGITFILLKADRFWPIAMFAAHGMTVLAHLVKFIDLRIVRHAYAIAIIAPAYLTLAILLVAVLRHQRRLKSAGVDRDWS